MPYLHKSNSKHYKVELKFPIYGNVAKCSTFTEDIRLATKIEDAIKTVYRKGLEENRDYWQILDALRPESQGKSGKLTAPQIFLHVRESTLHELLHDLNDADLDSVLKDYTSKMQPDRYVTHGINMISAYMPEKAKMSWLSNPQNILVMLLAAERGDITGKPNKRNSVHRRLFRAVSKILTYNLGQSRRNEIIEAVDYKAEDDTRMITLTNDEIYRLLDGLKMWNVKKHDTEIWLIALIAITTGADISDICRAKMRQMRLFEHDGQQWAEFYLEGTKKSQGIRRDRTVLLMPDVMNELYLIIKDKLTLSEVKIFETPQSRFYTVFSKVRSTIDLNHVRPKDLRALFSHLAEESGAPLTRIKTAMGHRSDSYKMTERYLRRQTGLGIDDVKRIQSLLNIEKQSSKAA